MPRRTDIKKVMVIGSGPIIIGQAAEFDYAGTQACRALREEGIEVVLINSNPATIMTDTEIADNAMFLVEQTMSLLWDKTKRDGPVSAGYIRQLHARLEDVFRLHPEFDTPPRTLGDLELWSFAELLEAAAESLALTASRPLAVASPTASAARAASLASVCSRS